MHRFERAIVRRPASTFGEGLTTFEGPAPDHARMLEQHAAYVAALRGAGLTVTELPALEAFPDAHFVEDVALIVPELAIATRPGAGAREGEVATMLDTLALLCGDRPRAQLEAPATLDGGDVLVHERRVLVGRSERSNAAGVAALRELLEPRGYAVVEVPVAEGLHFKSSVTALGPRTLVAAPSFASLPQLTQGAPEPVEVLALPEAEAYAANTLRINDTVLIPAGFPTLAEYVDRWTRAQAEALSVVALEMSEAQKMDGALTCLSLRF